MNATQERRSAPRVYVPQAGQRVRLKKMSDYAQLGLEHWSVLIALPGPSDLPVVCQRALTVHGEHDGMLVAVPRHLIETPVGWQPTYTIHVAPEKLDDLLRWLKRGLSVRFSQYIGDGSVSYQPLADTGEADGPSSWRFTELTDVIKPEEVTDCVRVVKIESVYDASIPYPCEYCDGTGIHKSNKALIDQTIAISNCPRCGVHTGFSFEEPWHNMPERYYLGSARADCADVRSPGWCWCCQGTGRGALYIAGIKDKKLRKAAIEQLSREGWKVWYQKQGNIWRMDRETVVKELGEVAPEPTTAAATEKVGEE